jgi:Protein of unknown function (DUF3298)
MRLSLPLIASLLVIAPAQFAAAEEKPAIAIKTRAIEASVTIDAALKVYPGLYEDLLAEGQKQVAKWRTDADKEMRENPDLFKDGRKWTTERSYSQRSVVGRYVSILRDDGTFEGGAHPNSHADTILWDIETKKRISVRPFFKETADNGPTMTALARLARVAVAVQKLERNENYGEKQKIAPEKFAAENQDLQTSIEPKLLKLGPVTLAPSSIAGKSSGLTFHYSPYAVGAYAEGPYTAFVPWTTFRQFLTLEGEAIFGGERPKKDADDY